MDWATSTPSRPSREPSRGRGSISAERARDPGLAMETGPDQLPEFMPECLRRTALLAVLWAAGPLSAFTAAGHGPGLYAVFETSAGEFACALHFEEAPLTVANFVGLAEGTQPWRKLESSPDNAGDGVLYRRPYFDGLIFHRVVGGFVIQTGSRNGLGTDGPGYTLPDEIVPSLRHDAAGVLSMANTGTPNTGGSQFFVTLDATPHLDGIHAVFGRVVEGLDVVQAIGLTNPATDPITIHSIEIVREGAAAEAFVADAPGLPRLQELDFLYEPVQRRLVYQVPEEGVYQIYGTEDLAAWTLGRQVSVPPVGEERSVDVSGLLASVESYFFRGTYTRYAPALDRTGRTLRLDMADRPDFTFVLTSDSGATYTEGADAGVASYTWEEIGNTAMVTIYYLSDDAAYPSGVRLLIAHLADHTATSGSLLGRFYSTSAQPTGGGQYNFFPRSLLSQSTGTYLLTVTPEE
jgi:cyclophilin family peptidyl-prolyl cis-trans isomerase